MKVGILGGTFDPVHSGHVMMAEEARNALDLDEVVFIPAGRPLTREQPYAPAEDRLNMVQLAVEGRERLSVSTIELDRHGPSYAEDTLEELGQKYGHGADFYFIMGWDSLEQFQHWRGPRRIIEMCTIVAVPRPGYTKPDPGALEAAVPGISSRVVFLDKPRVDISATLIRRLAAEGKSLDKYVPRPVAEYIREHGLYRNNREA